jgi:hypothetical protein
MSTIKISELPKFSTINANTSNTLFVGVDIPSAQTFQFSAGTLAAGLFANTALVVGNNRISYDNTVAQFSGVSNNYLQINFQNFSTGTKASSDFVVSTDDSDNITKFVDLGISNGNYSDPVNYSAFSGYDAYLYNYGPSVSGARGNLIIGTGSSDAKIMFLAGGVMAQNIVAWMTNTGLKLNTQSYITFSDGTTQTTAAASNAYSQAAFALANTTVTNQAAINSTQNTSITAAFTKANNALANTTGIFAGDLTLTGNLIATGIQSTIGAITTGNLIINGATTSNGTANITGTLNVAGIVNMNAQVVLTNTSFSATQAALTITATPTVATPSQDGYMIHISGKQNVSSRIVADSYGVNTYVVYAGRSARGNVSNPSAVKTGDILTRFSGNGYGTTGYAALGSGRLDIVAIEDHTDTARGTQLQLWNTPVGTNTLTNIATFNGVDVVFTGEVNPQKGFVFTPNVLSGITTTLSIDIANTSLFSFKTNATTTISLSGYKAGKIVEVWLTNTDTGGGSNHTITHGCLANNSTIGTASFTLSSLHSAYIKYFSIDGDLANTFCQVTYS